jgi:hypothetical protein
VPQGSVHATILYILCINNVPAEPGTHLALFDDATCIYETERYEHSVLCNLQRGLTVVKIRGVSAGTKRPVKEKLWRSISPEDLESLTTYYN